MGLTELYLIFALATAAATIYELVWPVMKKIRQTDPDLNVSKQWKLTTTVFFLMSVLAAPFLIIPCVWPSKGESFRNSLYLSLQQTK